MAAYNGDASNNAAVTSGTALEPVVVTSATPTISTSQQPASAVVGGSIADKATVSGGDNPTGTVTFTLYSNATASGTPLYTDANVALVGGVATSVGYTATTTGTGLLGGYLLTATPTTTPSPAARPPSRWSSAPPPSSRTPASPTPTSSPTAATPTAPRARPGPSPATPASQEPTQAALGRPPPRTATAGPPSPEPRQVFLSSLSLHAGDPHCLLRGGPAQRLWPPTDPGQRRRRERGRRDHPVQRQLGPLHHDDLHHHDGGQLHHPVRGDQQQRRQRQLHRRGQHRRGDAGGPGHPDHQYQPAAGQRHGGQFHCRQGHRHGRGQPHRHGDVHALQQPQRHGHAAVHRRRSWPWSAAWPPPSATRPRPTGTDYWVAAYNGDANSNPVTSGTASEPVVISAASPGTPTAPLFQDAGFLQPQRRRQRRLRLRPRGHAVDLHRQCRRRGRRRRLGGGRRPGRRRPGRLPPEPRQYFSVAVPRAGDLHRLLRGGPAQRLWAPTDPGQRRRA